MAYGTMPYGFWVLYFLIIMVTVPIYFILSLPKLLIHYGIVGLKKIGNLFGGFIKEN